MKKPLIYNDTLAHLEHRAGLLKERIYGTIILLAVLISIDPTHASAEHTLLIVAGTIASVWAASIVAAQMSRRIIMQQLALRPDQLEERFAEHAPLLAAGIIPVFLISLSVLEAWPLTYGVNGAIIYSIALMLFWSLLSARAVHASKWMTFFVAGLELLIGLGVVALKLISSH